MSAWQALSSLLPGTSLAVVYILDRHPRKEMGDPQASWGLQVDIKRGYNCNEEVCGASSVVLGKAVSPLLRVRSWSAAGNSCIGLQQVQECCASIQLFQTASCLQDGLRGSPPDQPVYGVKLPLSAASLWGLLLGRTCVIYGFHGQVSVSSPLISMREDCYGR